MLIFLSILLNTIFTIVTKHYNADLSNFVHSASTNLKTF